MKDEPKHFLPGVLGLIAEEISEDVAVKLAKARGGRMIYIPQNPAASSVLVAIVGVAAAREIAKLLGHGDLMVPKGSLGGAKGRRRKIAELWRSGLTHTQIASEVDVHTRTVERVVAELRHEREPQLPLTFKF